VANSKPEEKLNHSRSDYYLLENGSIFWLDYWQTNKDNGMASSCDGYFQKNLSCKELAVKS